MKPLKIVQFGSSLLREKTRAITKKEIDTRQFKNLVKHMMVTIDTEEGIGLAAPQVGSSLSLFIIHMHPTSNRPNLKEQNVAIIINPKITHYGKEREEDWEACLSLPNVYGLVPRSKIIQVQYQNERGREMKRELSNLEARVFQHEYDHINGILFVDRMKDMTSLTTGAEFRKLLKKNFKEIKHERR